MRKARAVASAAGEWGQKNESGSLDIGPPTCATSFGHQPAGRLRPKGRVMNARQRLPQRRCSLNFDFECRGLRYTCTYSRLSDGRVGEVFLNLRGKTEHCLIAGRGKPADLVEK